MLEKWKSYKKNCYIGIGLILSIILAGCAIGIGMSRVETPDYEVISSFKNIEVREYSSMIIAEVSIEGNRTQSVGDGFRLLADYIFGNNIEKEKIAMTAPVQQQQSFEKNWEIRFVMPSDYAIDNLPKPQNTKVKIKEMPAHQCILIRFSGARSDKNLDKNLTKLMDHIEKNGIKLAGSPIYSFYDPPWIPSFMRRNEIMFTIDR